MSSIRILVTGAKGRMGQAVIRATESDPDTVVGAAIDMGDSLDEALAKCDAVIDFTSHHFSNELVAACVKHKKALVMGTTGHTDEERNTIREAAKTIPVVFAANFSVGVNTLFWLTRQAARILGEPFDLEVIEMHHRMKTDSPSGTARRLVEILCEESGVSYDKDTRHGRFGDVGARTKKEIGVHALRGGDVVGDHTVVFANIGERVELTHKASSRDTFAGGSVRAAKWLSDKSAGIYDMQDVLGLK
ncbi:dihydrodipicolinate reductase [Roseimicrobium gellanilyticum]|uniref:4-hydroxy-tetrahydrodipicolinate reductase n=1 Tax=Roseimicrobium gellanilyticum TaxID=748857 RepID=A0A366HN95_9BACT|nr:4-hydroxy-tetrahydrodipicolinate reductase [Roseimicrobium gellanilyticum]RBP44628.1 dihydrodipicolinate reductase [Roseimicrobium gellanilyticum]